MITSREDWKPMNINGLLFNKTWKCTLLDTTMMYPDGKRWQHVSLASQRGKMPTYAQMAAVKECFIGKDKKAIMVFPPEDEHVNTHKYCLHLYHCLDGDGLPDFRFLGEI